MPDREKVIEKLKAMHDFLGVGLSSQTQVFEEDQKILEDAIAMLKEQDAVKPKKADNPEESEYCCGICGYPLWLDEFYCAHCGRRIGWEGR